MEKKLSNGKIVALIFLSLLIVGLIVTSFIFASPGKFEISVSIITLICILLIIVLSNSFDNFSIAKVITISRVAEESKKKVDKLEAEKNELILKLININFQSQSSSNNVFVGEAIAKSIAVQKANPDEVKENKSEEFSEPAPRTRRIDQEKFESLVLNKYFGVNKIDSILREVKVVTQFQGLDPISDRTVYFDAYQNDSGKESFIEITRQNFSSLMLHDRLYIQLNKLFHYKNAKNTNATLVLLIAKTPEEESTPSFRSFDRIKGYFAPAITSGLLTIQYVEITKEEYEQLFS